MSTIVLNEDAVLFLGNGEKAAVMLPYDPRTTGEPLDAIQRGDWWYFDFHMLRYKVSTFGVRDETEETHMYTYRITTNDQDLHGIETVSYDHIGFDDDGNEIIEITTERDVGLQLDQSPAVIKYEIV